MESIIQEIATNRKKPTAGLARWLAIFSPPPPEAVKIASLPNIQGKAAVWASWPHMHTTKMSIFQNPYQSKPKKDLQQWSLKEKGKL